MNAAKALTGRGLDARVAQMLNLPLHPPCPTLHNTDDAQYDRELGWMGWCYTCDKSIGEVEPQAAGYSTSLDSAWSAMQAFKQMISLSDSRWFAYVAALPAYPYHMGHRELAHAICRAIVLALDGEGAP